MTTLLSRTSLFLGVFLLCVSLGTPSAAHAEITDEQRDQDYQWLDETGGWLDAYPYDATLFYYTLPSYAKAFSLHPFHRNSYYRYYHTELPAEGTEPAGTDRIRARSCGNYSFFRPNSRIAPYGYQCQ